MEEKVMTVEEIDQHLQQSEATATRDITTVATDICKTYGDVRPILIFAKNLLFFKPKWKAVLQSLMDVLDKTCNIQANSGSGNDTDNSTDTGNSNNN